MSRPKRAPAGAAWRSTNIRSATTPYAEDMGRTANRFIVQGYLIGPNYLDLRDALITALEQDGPGILHFAAAVHDEATCK